MNPVRDLVRSWKNLTEVTVTGNHFIQEDSPDEIGEAITVPSQEIPNIQLPGTFNPRRQPCLASLS